MYLLNQMAGPLFFELAEDLADVHDKECWLITGHPDTLLKNTDGSNLRVLRAPTYNKKNYFLRVYSWILYLVSVSKYLMGARKEDEYLLTSNPPLLGAWVWLFSVFFPIRYSVLVYDMYPDVLVKTGIFSERNLIVRLWRMANRLVYNKARHVVAIGDQMADRIERDLKNKKIEIVPIWVDTEKIYPIPRKLNAHFQRFAREDEFVVLYSGNMGESHDIESIVEVAKMFNGKSALRFIFIGGGARFDYVARCKEELGLANISLHPYQPEDLLPYSLSIADISIVSLEEGLEDLMIPSKTLYYMAVGSPVLAICNESSDLANIIKDNNCGVIVDIGNPKKLYDTLASLISGKTKLAEMSQGSLCAVRDKYSRKVNTKKFIDILRES